MLKNRTLKLAFYTLLLACLGQSATLAAQEPVIGALSAADRQYMADSKSQLDAIARSRLGRQIRGDKNNDLAVLQALLDQRAVKAEQTRELQAMGMVLGDLLAAELGMEWVTYSDNVGRSRALRLGTSDHYLFPVTMISRRVEAGARVSIEAVYDKAYALIAPHRTPLPFQ